MKPELLFRQFEELSERLEIRLVEDRGNFVGGGCLLREERCIVLNKHRPIEQKLRVLANAFGELDLSAVYVVPSLRSYIEAVSPPLLNPGAKEKP